MTEPRDDELAAMLVARADRMPVSGRPIPLPIASAMTIVNVAPALATALTIAGTS